MTARARVTEVMQERTTSTIAGEVIDMAGVKPAIVDEVPEVGMIMRIHEDRFITLARVDPAR